MDPPPFPKLQTRRPSLSLTVACAVAFLVALQAFAFSFGPDFRNLGARWVPGFVLGSSLVSIVFLVALWWRMQRWALWGFLAVAAAQNVAWVHLGWWRPTMLLLPALVGGAAAWNWARLR